MQNIREILVQLLARCVKNISAIIQSICFKSLHNAASSYDLQEIIVNCLEWKSGESSRFCFNGQKGVLVSDAALSMLLALHEFSTNALKYGALFNNIYQVEIEW